MSKECEELHYKLMHVDRIIKKVKNSEYFGSGDIISIEAKPVVIPNSTLFPKHTDTKVVVLKAIDNIEQAASLRQIQEEYEGFSGNKINIWDNIRSLNNSGLILMMKEKTATRGIFCLKRNGLRMAKY